MIPDKKFLLSLKNVGVRYRRAFGFKKKNYYWALRDVSFDVYHGETLGILGKNGAGKSTLLRLLAGIIEPDKGVVFREDGIRASLLSLQVGFSGHLSGRQNIIMSGILLGLKRREIQKLIEPIVEFSGLGEFIDQPVCTYSSGMRARLGFAVAAYADPDIILIDEVLGVGDADFRKKSSKFIREKLISKKTVLLVSHNPATIANLCTRAVWLEGGRAVKVGKVEEVLGSYEKSFAAIKKKSL